MRHAPIVRHRWLFLALVTLALAGCGDDGQDSAPPSDEPAASATATATEPPDPPASVDAEILGESTTFAAGASGVADVEVTVHERECLFADALPLSCRASTGAGGAFVVTAEGNPDLPGEWNVVVRCGLAPAVPVASASGDFQPVISDLGLTPYGELAGITLVRDDDAEAALVYQPTGAACPVVWGIGKVDPTSLFTGGTDALSGDEAPIRFRAASGSDACAIADGQGGMMIGKPQGSTCS